MFTYVVARIFVACLAVFIFYASKCLCMTSFAVLSPGLMGTLQGFAWAPHLIDREWGRLSFSGGLPMIGISSNLLQFWTGLRLSFNRWLGEGDIDCGKQRYGQANSDCAQKKHPRKKPAPFRRRFQFAQLIQESVFFFFGFHDLPVNKYRNNVGNQGAQQEKR